MTQCQVTNLCAAGTNGTGTCQGDSGSSLQQYSDEHNVWIQVTRDTGHVTCCDMLHVTSDTWPVVTCYILMSGFSTGLSASAPPRVVAQVRGSP